MCGAASGPPFFARFRAPAPLALPWGDWYIPQSMVVPRFPDFRVLLPALLAALFLWTSVAHAQTLTLSNLVVDNKAGTFTARFGVGVTGVDEIAEVLANGVVLALRCQATLLRKRSYWMDAAVAETTSVSTIRRDAISREFMLRLDGREAPLTGKQLAPLLAQAWGQIQLDLGPWDRLKRGEEYQLRLRLSLDRTEIPDWVRDTVFFWSWDVVPATNYTLEFAY